MYGTDTFTRMRTSECTSSFVPNGPLIKRVKKTRENRSTINHHIAVVLRNQTYSHTNGVIRVKKSITRRDFRQNKTTRQNIRTRKQPITPLLRIQNYADNNRVNKS